MNKTTRTKANEAPSEIERLARVIERLESTIARLENRLDKVERRIDWSKPEMWS